MSIGIGVIVFFVSLIALVAEFILYFIFGFGASFSGNISTLEGVAFFFVGLMVLTVTIGFLYPLFAIIATVTKRKSLCTRLFILILGIIFIGYFFIFPASIKKVKITAASKQVKVEKLVNIEKPKETIGQENDIEKRYIKEFLLLKDIKVIDGYGKFDVPGYSNTKKAVKGSIKNIGNKTMALLQITVYFLDSNGARIGEKKITVLSTKSIFEPDPAFKPNYTKDFGYIIEDDVPSDWSGKVEVEISKIKFEE
jgi:hypothetical protein